MADVIYPCAHNGHWASLDQTLPALAGSGLGGDAMAGWGMSQAYGLDLRSTAAILPILSQSADFAMEDLFKPPLANEVNTDDEAHFCLGEPMTPKFIPGLQDNYTGLIGAAPGLEAAPLKVNVQFEAPIGHDQATARTAKEAFEDDRSTSQTTNITGCLDRSVENNDSTKLQRLISLHLHCAVETGAEQQKKSGAIGVRDRNPSKETATRSEEEYADTDSNKASESSSPYGGDGVAFSHGSVGHPNNCAAPCKYFSKRRGCMDGLACSHCHICVFRPKRPQRQKATAKLEQYSLRSSMSFQSEAIMVN